MSQYKLYRNLKQVKWLKKETQWIAHRRELLESWSWKSMSINCRKLIDFLELRYLENAGYENGFYIATYRQLQKFGINLRFIKSAIEEAKTKGLIKYVISETVGKYGKYTYVFCLTYLPQTIKKDNQIIGFIAPTDEWKYLKNNRNK